MSRIISGKVRLDVQRVDIQEGVQAALAAVRHSAESKEIRLQIVLDPRAGPVLGDPGRLQQCIWNLLSNAIKFTPSGGHVAVAVRRVDARVEVRVSDTGIGIEPRFLPQLFERFSQADPSPTRRHGGLGLGLSIARHLVELHGGTVHAQSDGPGLGATFAIRLPVSVTLPASAVPEDPEPPAVDPAPAEPRSIDLAGVRVLVVDDQPDARSLAERLLADCGAEVWSAGSGEDAIAQAVAARPDIVVSDICMPGMDGYEMLRRIRERGAIPAVRAIALTAFARPQDAARAREAGFDAFLTKPVDAPRLIAAVAELAGRAASPMPASLAGMPC
jgi:CheY-like chemotaxis protein